MVHLDVRFQIPCRKQKLVRLYAAMVGNEMRTFVVALFVVYACGNLGAQKTVWQPSPGHKQVPIWPSAVPDPRPIKEPESAEITGKDSLVAGTPWVAVSDVSQPTMTVYSPEGKNTRRRGCRFSGRRISDSRYRS